jgi:hypothetical protein
LNTQQHALTEQYGIARATHHPLDKAGLRSSFPPQKPKYLSGTPGTCESKRRGEHIGIGKLLRTHIQNDTRGEDELPKAERLQELQDIRDNHLRRQRQCGTATLKSKFPDKFDQADENHWLAKWAWDNFPKYLVPATKSKAKGKEMCGAKLASLAQEDVDQDDEEEPPPARVKVEPTEDDGMSNAGRQAEGREEEAARAPHQDSKTSQLLAKETSDKAGAEVKIKRMWKFVNGKCIVWPPFDVPAGTEAKVKTGSKTSGTASTSRGAEVEFGTKIKREHEDDLEGAAVKKRRFW